MAREGDSDLIDCVQFRMAREREKALEKYGQKALAPGGNPDYDIIDYAINEVVGLHRYAEMISARTDQNPNWPVEVQETMRHLAYRMRQFSLDVGERLILERNQLLAEEFILGAPEVR